MLSWYFNLDTFVVNDSTDLAFLEDIDSLLREITSASSQEFLAQFSPESESHLEISNLNDFKWVNPFA